MSKSAAVPLLVLAITITALGVSAFFVFCVLNRWVVHFEEHFNKTFFRSMADTEYERHLADEARKAGKERHPAGVCCFYSNVRIFQLIIWSFVLTWPLIIFGGALFAAWRMLPSSHHGHDHGPLGAIIGVSIGLGVFAAVCFGGCFVYWAKVGLEVRDEGDVKMEEDARNISMNVAERLRDGTIRLLSCAWLRTRGASAPPLARMQDLPRKAFLPPADAVKAHRRGAVYVLSYGWASAP